MLGLLLLQKKPSHTPASNLPPEEIKRIVSLAPNLTEILFELGLGDKIIAVSNTCNYPPEVKNKKRAGSFWQPSLEDIIAVRPELVVTLAFEQQKAVAQTLTRLNYNVLTVDIEKIQQLFSAIKQIGSATKTQSSAENLVKKIDSQLNNIKSKLSNVQKPKVLWVIQTNPILVASQNTFINEIIQLAVAQNAIGPTLQQYPSIGSEQILACNPDIIIQSSMGNTDISAQQKNAIAYWRNLYPGISAVKNDRIYVINSDIVLRLGPRLPLGVKTVACLIHPDIFKEKNNGK